ncbi:hypothetical protein [Tessaracoccus sp. Z1128]
MSSTLRRTAALVATAALAVSMSACTAGQWEYAAPPAAGVQKDEGGLKLRNVLVVTDGEGKGMILGGIASRDEAATVVGLGYAAEKDDGSYGELNAVAFEADIPKGKTIILDGADTSFNSSELLIGRLARVAVVFESGERVILTVPVVSAEHADFADAWQQANA